MNNSAPWNLACKASALAQSWLPVGVLGLSLAINVYLGYRLDATPAVRTVAHVKAGESFPRLSAEGPRGERVNIDWPSSGNETVLYIFSPSCIWCARNLNNIKAIVAARGLSYRFIGVSLTRTGLPEYLAKNSLPFPVYSIDAATAKTAKLGGTPETIVISRDGRVQRDISGAFTGISQQQAESLFKLHLPGLIVQGAS